MKKSTKKTLFNVEKDILACLGLLAAGLIIGMSLFPSIWLFTQVLKIKSAINSNVFLLLSAVSIGILYMVFGIILLLFIVFLRHVLNLNSSPQSEKIRSKALFGFAAYHGLIAIPEQFFLPLIRGTFILSLFYKGLGARIGKNTIINTLRISDCNLVEIGDNCTIGGDVIINGHSAEGDTCFKGKVLIGNNVSIGSYTTILPGVVIEDNVIIGANSLVPKNQLLKSNGVYGGVPVRLIKDGIKPKHISAEVGISNIPKEELMKLRDNDKYVSILVSQYEKLHGEILAIEGFITNMFVASLGILFSVVTYSIVEPKISLLLMIAPLAGLSAALLMSTTTAMLRVAYKMSEIEIYFQSAGYKLFNWENKYGALGVARIRELDGILIQIIYALLILVGHYLTFSGKITQVTENIFEGLNVKTLLIILNGLIDIWLLISIVYMIRKTRYFKQELNSLRSQLLN